MPFLVGFGRIQMKKHDADIAYFVCHRIAFQFNGILAFSSHAIVCSSGGVIELPKLG
jgi:hypothetical protein